MLVVVGSKSSSNSNRLREMADKNVKPGYLSMDRKIYVGMVRGGQGPWSDGRRFRARGAGAGRHRANCASGRGSGAELDGRKEHVIFALPKALRDVENQQQSYVG